jgi:hypothetical protein
MVGKEEMVEVLEFPIQEANGETKMKNINLPSLNCFHGLVYEDPNTLLLEFAVICRKYDYTNDEKNLKLFPSTLKDSTLRGFIVLEGNNIKTWDHMKNTFM